MKTKWILGSLIAVTSMAHAQFFLPAAGAPATSIFRTGKTGFGTAAAPVGASKQVEILAATTVDDGLKVTQSGTGNTAVILDNTGVGGQAWTINSLGSGSGLGAGHFLVQTGGNTRFFIDRSVGNVGIGTTGPAYRLDVSSGVSNAGIRLTQSGSGDCSLHLNNSGGKDWTMNSTSTGNLQVQSNSTDRFLVDGSTGYFGIGTTSPGNRLHVEELNSTAGMGGYFNYSTGSTGGGNGITAIANNVGAVGTQQNIGVDAYGNVGAVGSAIAIGLRGSGAGGNESYGGVFKAAGGTSSLRTAGIYAVINSGNANSAVSAAVYGDANGFTAANEWAGYFRGNVQITGNLFNNATMIFSDRRLKKDIRPLENVMDKIQKLNGYTYTFRTDEFKERNLDKEAHIGFIAQEVKEVFPELVRENGEGFYAVDYQAMVPVLLEAIKVQQKNTDALKASLQKQIDEQNQVISDLLAKSGSATGINQANSTDAGFSMGQNEPNPFTNETVVNYTLPTQVGSAYMAVYDLSGKQITTFPVNQNGASSITITSEKLAAGIYIYSIVADGKIVDSKRMIVANK